MPDSDNMIPRNSHSIFSDRHSVENFADQSSPRSGGLLTRLHGIVRLYWRDARTTRLALYLHTLLGSMYQPIKNWNDLKFLCSCMPYVHMFRRRGAVEAGRRDFGEEKAG
jgi:hypothetical protein